MAEIVWTRSSLHDLQEIHGYVSEDSAYYADRLVLKLISRVEILEKHPKAGRIVPEKEDVNIRELIEGNYRIFYDISSESKVFVLRIHHGSRNIEK